MNRRGFLAGLAGVAAAGSVWRLTAADDGDSAMQEGPRLQGGTLEKIEKSEAEWREILSQEQFEVLRKEATERPFSSPLNNEKRDGEYVCAGCDLPLFKSEWKFESGTGWPSFYTAIEGHVGKKRDFKLILPRTEYHCARCGGHQGHLFNDGPEPTGERWCNNGAALRFVPA